MTEKKRRQEINELSVPGGGQVSGGQTEQMASRRENTRSRIALIYVIAYLAIIAGAIIIGAIRDFTISEHKDILLAISGILSGPLGFIIGYYFKASSGE